MQRGRRVGRVRVGWGGGPPWSRMMAASLAVAVPSTSSWRSTVAGAIPLPDPGAGSQGGMSLGGHYSAPLADTDRQWFPNI